jgi:hypothetical protein
MGSTGKLLTNFSSCSSVKPLRLPSSLTTSIRRALAVRVRRHVEVSNVKSSSILNTESRERLPASAQ